MVAWPQNEAEVRRCWTRAAEAVVRVLPEFERDVRRGRPGQVQVLLDGTNSNTASLVSSYAGRSWRLFRRGERAGSRTSEF